MINALILAENEIRMSQDYDYNKKGDAILSNKTSPLVLLFIFFDTTYSKRNDEHHINQPNKAIHHISDNVLWQ